MHGVHVLAPHMMFEEEGHHVRRELVAGLPFLLDVVRLLVGKLIHHHLPLVLGDRRLEFVAGVKDERVREIEGGREIDGLVPGGCKVAECSFPDMGLEMRVRVLEMRDDFEGLVGGSGVKKHKAVDHVLD